MVTFSDEYFFRGFGVATVSMNGVTSDIGPIAWEEPKSVAAEAFRILRTNLQFTNPDRPLRSLLITSPEVGDGKSTVTANLGVSLAQSGKRIVIVNTDLRRPSVHKLFGVADGVGLTSVLVGQASVAEALRDTSVPGLRLLTAGPMPPNPAELLESQRMRTVIAELEQEADIVLYDAPPVIAVTDAGLLAPYVDGCILVVSVGTTQRELARAAAEQLQRLGGHVLGVVLNRMNHGAGYYYYYYHEDADETARSPIAGMWEKMKSGILGVRR